MNIENKNKIITIRVKIPNGYYLSHCVAYRDKSYGMVTPEWEEIKELTNEEIEKIINHNIDPLYQIDQDSALIGAIHIMKYLLGNSKMDKNE